MSYQEIPKNGRNKGVPQAAKKLHKWGKGRGSRELARDDMERLNGGRQVDAMSYHKLPEKGRYWEEGMGNR